MTYNHTFERKQPFYENPSATSGTRSTRLSRRQFPEQQRMRFETVSGQAAEDMCIHYSSAKPSDAQPIQFLKPLGTMSYLRSSDVRDALRNYHTVCDGIPEENILEQYALDQLVEALHTVQGACEADNPLHRNLRAQVELELRICSRLQEFQTKADAMANLISEEINREQQDYIRRLYYASKILENRRNMITGEIYNEGDFSFIEKIFSTANTLVTVQDSQITREEAIAREEALVRLHVKRLYAILDNQDAPPALKNAIRQILPLTSNIPVKYGTGGKSTTLMKPERGALMPVNPYGPANAEGEHSDLVFGVQRGDETVDTAHGSFLHELTHAAVQRTFHGTPLHLGFSLPKRNKKKAIRSKFESVYKYRSGMVRKLDRLIRGEKASENSPFSDNQLKQLSDKLAYGAGRTLLSQYAIDIGNISNDDPRQGLQGDKKTLFVDIEGMLADRQSHYEGYKVHGSVFMEYDTTINQMLLWCYDWEIPQDNPVYEALAEAAQIEVDRRARHINARAQAEP